MKTTYQTVLFLLLFISSSIEVNAQFLKRLNSEVKRSAENAAIRSAEQIAADAAGDAIEKGVSKGIESLFANKFGDITSSVKSVDPSTLPESYEFEWMYTLQMGNKDGLMNIDYFLKPKATYFGIKPNMKQANSMEIMFMVMDLERKANTIFMESNGGKMAMPTSFSTDMDIESENELQEYSFKEIGSKTILGYQCQGYKMENEDSVMIMYITKKAPVSFTQLFSAETKNIPKGFNPKWLDKLENGLVMEMEYKNKNENNEITNMRCIALNKNSFTINKSDYQFINMTSN